MLASEGNEMLPDANALCEDLDNNPGASVTEPSQ